MAVSLWYVCADCELFCRRRRRYAHTHTKRKRRSGGRRGRRTHAHARGRERGDVSIGREIDTHTHTPEKERESVCVYACVSKNVLLVFNEAYEARRKEENSRSYHTHSLEN